MQIFVANSGRLIWYLLPLERNFVDMVVTYSEISPKYSDTKLSILGPSIEAILFSYADALSKFVFRLEQISTLQLSSPALTWKVELWQTCMIVWPLLLPLKRIYVDLVLYLSVTREIYLNAVGMPVRVVLLSYAHMIITELLIHLVFS
jgi:hypothetical protein